MGCGPSTEGVGNSGDVLQRRLMQQVPEEANVFYGVERDMRYSMPYRKDPRKSLEERLLIQQTREYYRLINN